MHVTEVPYTCNHKENMQKNNAFNNNISIIMLQKLQHRPGSLCFTLPDQEYGI